MLHKHPFSTTQLKCFGYALEQTSAGNYVTVLCKSNDSEFRRISTKFYEILRKSAKFRGERIFGEISLASIVSPLTKFRADVRNFTWQIRWRWQNSFEISLVGAKFRSKFRKWERNFKRNFASGCEISNEISNTSFVWAKFRTKISFGDRNFVHHLWSLHEGHKMQNENGWPENTDRRSMDPPYGPGPWTALRTGPRTISTDPLYGPPQKTQN